MLWLMSHRSHVVQLGRSCRFSFAIISTLLLGAAVSPTQVLQHKKPTELLIKQYEKLAAEGSLLTPDGWSRASILFDRSDPYPPDGEIQLKSGPGVIGETQRSGDHAEVWTKWGDYYGTIDSYLRYKPPAPKGRIMLEESFSLVFVDRPHGGAVTAGSSGQWLIKGPLHTRSADIPHAIRYVEAMRDKSNDPVIRRNADKTITDLKRFTGCGSASAC